MPSLEWTGVDVVLETEGYGDEEEVEDEHGEPHGLKWEGAYLYDIRIDSGCFPGRRVALSEGRGTFLQTSHKKEHPLVIFQLKMSMEKKTSMSIPKRMAMEQTMPVALTLTPGTSAS